MTFCQLQTSRDYCKYSFFRLAIVQWNALPETVACLPDLDSFKVAAKLAATQVHKSRDSCFNLILISTSLF